MFLREQHHRNSTGLTFFQADGQAICRIHLHHFLSLINRSLPLNATSITKVQADQAYEKNKSLKSSSFRDYFNDHLFIFMLS